MYFFVADGNRVNDLPIEGKEEIQDAGWEAYWGK